MKFFKSHFLSIITLIILIPVAISIVYLFTQNQSLNNKINSIQIPPSYPPEKTIIIQKENDQKLPIIAFENKETIQAKDINEITAKVINPLIDFTRDEMGDNQIISITISENLLTSKNTYPFVAKIVYKDNAVKSFLIGKSEDQIDYYIPECLNGCVFTDKFRAKYPEIVSIYK